ncbi:molybdopterin-binding protein [Hansschlegelia beijingensis]|uniref:Molybdopterin molybdenumtransferase n=1 Tax=Hansschlegelia beijingensis TaxID=1133344 RepID=A0A7W6CZN1_9HYPH|nr:molybdopterin-binding protein [Hansschlegelia beijingensis]MBB3974033.1 molybdopterin biosynthesis enzyme [Hansschlegelia beijingensis]
MSGAASRALAPLDEALALLAGLASPVAATQVLSAAAIGRVSAADVLAPVDVPACRTALRDGWAADAASITGASPYAPVTPRRPPVWVEAGAPLPPGADVVLPPEALVGREIMEDAPALDGVRNAGEEVRAGALLLVAGERLTPMRHAGLAAAGVTSIAIRAPRLRLIMTGAPAPAVGDALSAAIAALSAAAGASVETLAAPDDVERIAKAIGADGADAIFVVGGTGEGRTDRSAEALGAAGDLMLHGLALRPGETAGLGAAAGRPVLLSPGRPEAALAVFVALLRPLLGVLSGAGAPPTQRAPLTRKIASTIGLTEVVFVRRVDGGVEPLGGAGLPIAQLSRADGAVLVNPDREGYPERAEVEVTPL